MDGRMKGCRTEADFRITKVQRLSVHTNGNTLQKIGLIIILHLPHTDHEESTDGAVHVQPKHKRWIEPKLGYH